MKRWLPLLPVLAVVAVFAVGSALLIRPAPHPPITRQTFDRIESRMLEQDVETLLGKKGVEPDPDNRPAFHWIVPFEGPYTWKEWKAGRNRICIAFDSNGQAVMGAFYAGGSP